MSRVGPVGRSQSSGTRTVPHSTRSPGGGVGSAAGHGPNSTAGRGAACAVGDASADVGGMGDISGVSVAMAAASAAVVAARRARGGVVRTLIAAFGATGVEVGMADGMAKLAIGRSVVQLGDNENDYR